MRTHGFLVRLLGGMAVIGFIAAGCSDDTATTDTTGAPVTDAPTTIAGAPENPDPVVVELHTGSIVVSQTVFAAGVINLEVTNVESDGHYLEIARGDSYEGLPKVADGEVDSEALGDDFILQTGLLLPALGATRDFTVDLTPGTYVFFCGVDHSKGPLAHVANGEVLLITVVG
ncbi:hypothetical protein BH10ACT2_BH10ACT2_15910 [soil metagenome]